MPKASLEKLNGVYDKTKNTAAYYFLNKGEVAQAGFEPTTLDNESKMLPDYTTAPKKRKYKLHVNPFF